MKKNKDNDKSSGEPILTPKKKIIFGIGLFLVTLIFLELTGRLAYRIMIPKEKDTLIKAFLAIETAYNPNMVSNYLPHHYLVYALRPGSEFKQKIGFVTKETKMINDMGYRGKPFTKEKPKGIFRIICIGGSTTFCLTEPDDSLTYPQLLEDGLNKQAGQRKFEVINAGTPGWSTAESLINLQFRLLDLNPDMVIVYHGVNDTFAMRTENEGNSDYSNFRQIVQFHIPSPFMRSVLKHSHLVRLIYSKTTKFAADINSLATKQIPNQKRSSEILMNATGKYFSRNMNTIASIAITYRVIPVLVTMGHNNWHPSIRRVNHITRAIAQQRQLPLVDFEPMSKPEFFASDRIHMLRPGNKARADAIMQTLLRIPQVRNHLN